MRELKESEQMFSGVPSKLVSITVRLPAKLYFHITKLAEEQNRSINKQVIQLLQERLEEGVTDATKSICSDK